MKGEKAFIQAHLILSKLYKGEYELEGKLYSCESLYRKYLFFLRKSAYAGFTKALYELGQTYEDINFWGINPHYSPKKCIYWYEKAITKNHPAAHNNLAGFYEKGEGIPQDINKALELYKKAGELGDTSGKKNYKIMLKQIKEGKYSLPST